MSLFTPAPPPETLLGRYRLLSPTAGVHVSPLQLGGASIGDKMGAVGVTLSKEGCFELLDKYYELGGNFIDTANNYQDEASETYIGEWAEKRGIRDQLFLATKYSLNYKERSQDVKQKVMYVGNNAKSLHISVEASLKKLRTTYIDLLYVHFWDWDTSIEEVMRALHNLVVQGKVIYLGVSDAPAWVVSRANTFARACGLTPFVIYQGAWNVMHRDFEREIIPMARAEGMALAPWNVLAQGKFRTDEEEERRRKTGEKGTTLFNPNWERSEKEKAMSKALEKVAGEVGTKHITSVAIAYLLHKAPYVFPIVGSRKIDQLLANIESLNISLTKEQIEYLESVIDFDLGFPTNLLGDGTDSAVFLRTAVYIEPRPVTGPLRSSNREKE